MIFLFFSSWPHHTLDSAFLSCVFLVLGLGSFLVVVLAWDMRGGIQGRGDGYAMFARRSFDSFLPDFCHALPGYPALVLFSNRLPSPNISMLISRYGLLQRRLDSSV